MEENNKYTKDFVLKNGVNFDDLWFTSYSDEILDNPEDEGGKPFTGLAFELFENGNLMYFCFYKDGLAHGLNREFYKSGKIKCEEYFKYGLVNGKSVCWHENGNIKSTSEVELSVKLNYKEWDENGKLLIAKELEQDKENAQYVTLLKRREINRNLGRE
ncbi:toxin-antitoxin system YwqK family antitoxin [Bacillus spizizenii]|nr:toxin-antitoxin system YwqK family antitoxin [Bacillus spizizenii]MCY8620508.1 toxin-antitoxin system YwqK family antitoxin [Bacillus spizizenii]MCY8629237.1 toxin-antitoxin system YwqK family antitoxin [Bacillus spizizenii]MCY8689799.1 toxin-antitoxin system YwqK family antitoxin [Bacillus spizizenii]MCY8999657.1 toxin-antitoxin system YwqK family antitoxin [Bacillus spizizenii]